MDQLLKSINELGEQLKQIDTKLCSKIDALDNKVSAYKQELEEIKQTQDVQETRLDQLERDVRVRNLVFFGIEETERSYFDLEDVVLKIINEDLKVACCKNDVQHIRRLGKKGEKPRPIIIGFTTLGKKIKILKNKSKLQGSTCYIKEDFPPKILKERKSLQEDLKKELDKGNRAIIKYNKLVIIPEKNTQNNIETPAGTNNTKKRSLDTSPSSANKNPNRQVQKKNKPSTENRNIKQYLTFQRPESPKTGGDTDNDDTT
ncbi:uncharacterized protein LOC134749646 [Cydia strobilella]|uniref:uncharacterized protein LOC134749646 n=1 Tax=Cydia strobilella TaxID=1100964 RepID=UPI0030045B23